MKLTRITAALSATALAAVLAGCGATTALTGSADDGTSATVSSGHRDGRRLRRGRARRQPGVARHGRGPRVRRGRRRRRHPRRQHREHRRRRRHRRRGHRDHHRPRHLPAVRHPRRPGGRRQRHRGRRAAWSSTGRRSPPRRRRRSPSLAADEAVVLLADGSTNTPRRRLGSYADADGARRMPRCTPRPTSPSPAPARCRVTGNANDGIGARTAWSSRRARSPSTRSTTASAARTTCASRAATITVTAGWRRAEVRQRRGGRPRLRRRPRWHRRPPRPATTASRRHPTSSSVAGR